MAAAVVVMLWMEEEEEEEMGLELLDGSGALFPLLLEEDGDEVCLEGGARGGK